MKPKRWKRWVGYYFVAGAIIAPLNEILNAPVNHIFSRAEILSFVLYPFLFFWGLYWIKKNPRRASHTSGKSATWAGHMKRTLWIVGGAIIGSITFSVSFGLLMDLTPAGIMIERMMIAVLGTGVAENVVTITIVIAVVLGAVGGGVAAWIHTSPNRTQSPTPAPRPSEDVV